MMRREMLMMQRHPDVVRLRRPKAAPSRRGLRGAIVLGFLLAGATARATGDTHCPGLPPSCHIRQQAVCLCAGPEWSSCKWQCAERIATQWVVYSDPDIEADDVVRVRRDRNGPCADPPSRIEGVGAPASGTVPS